jgi:hypothetical protein
LDYNHFVYLLKLIGKLAGSIIIIDFFYQTKLYKQFHFHLILKFTLVYL